ncbi:hypothetical protein BH23ACT9_BH23ACT9_16100 [soil metagenome]
MHIDAWDEVFIRCRRQSANGLIVHVPSWGEWWPGLAVGPVPGSAGHDLSFSTPLRLPRRQHLVLTADRVRPRDKGLEWSVTGDVTGTGEWYHLDHPGGVVVHYLLRGTLTSGNPRRWLAAHRSSVRAALTSLKTRLEAGRLPGAEPHPQLLAFQAGELATFAREVAQHEAEKAAAATAEGR